jgi:DHA1 family multidrug resistance protein-like MFS transporter
MGYPFRDTVAGFFVRFLSRNRFLKYPEEIEGFKILNVVNDAVHSTEKQPVSSAQTPTLLEDENELDENIEETLSSRHISADVDNAERGDRIAALYSTMDNVTHFVRTKDGIILVGWYSTGLSMRHRLIPSHLY